MEELPEFIKKQLFEFRKIYRNWFKEISDSFPEQKKDIIKYYKDHMNDSHLQILNQFFLNIKPYLETIINLDYSFFDNCPEFYKDIQYSYLFNLENGKSEQFRKSQMTYITKLSYMTLMLSDITKTKNIEFDTENMERYGPMVLKLLSNIQILDGSNMENLMKNLENSMNNENLNTANNNFLNTNPLLTDLADEIAKEVSIPDSFKNITNPQDIFKLMFDKDGKQFMEGMVKTVGEKIQTKIKSGKLNEKDLFNQAQQMMNTVFKDNPMFSSMMPGVASTQSNDDDKEKKRAELKKKLRENIKNRNNKK